MSDTRIQAIDLIIKGIFKIKDKSGKSIKFCPNKAQLIVLNRIRSAWVKGEKVHLIVIKGRQQGISTIIQVLQLVLCITTPGWQAYTMTHRLDLAKDIFEQKIKYAFDKLPESFKELLGVNKNNVRQLMFSKLDKSSVSVGTSGRGGTYQSIHISETGKMSESQELWNEMITGTLEAGNYADLVIHESTADGGLGLFYELVNNSPDDVLFLSWTLQDEYVLNVPSDSKWLKEYAQLARDYQLCQDPIKTYNLSQNQFYWYYVKAKSLKEQIKVQYPLCLEEAFISTSTNYFNLNIIQACKEKIANIQYTEIENFKIYIKPKPRTKYVAVVDPSTGEANDNTSINVFDIYTMEQVACSTGKYSEEITARMIVKISNYYNQAVIGVEINNMGRAVQNFIERLGYSEDLFYYRYEVDSTSPRLQKVPKVGWLTTSATRPILISEFKTAFESHEIIINDIDTLNEMVYFVNHNGKMQAQSGKFDDRVLSCMIGYQVAKFVHQNL